MRRLSLVVLVALAACQPPGSPARQPGSVASPTVAPAAAPGHYSAEPAPRAGGTVSVGEWDLPPALPAIFNQPATAIWIEQAVFSALVGVDPALGYYGDLARDVPTPENGAARLVGSGMDVTYTLRAGLRWSDGQPVTPDDVVFTWHAQQAQEGYSLISGIDRSGDSLTMHFKAVYPAYLLLFGAIVPAHRLASIDAAHLASDPYWTKPDVVSGPFTVADAPGDRYVLARNPHYADGRSGMSPLGHAPHLDRLVVQGFATKEEELAALKAGEIAVALDLNERDLDAAAAMGQHLVAVPGLAYEQVTLNRADPLFKDDPGLAAALLEGVDRTAVVDAALKGRAPLAQSPLSPALEWVMQPAPLALDAAAAARALDADGWTAGSAGSTRSKGGRPLRLTLVTTAGNPLRAAEVEAVAAGWRRLGADVAVQGASAQVLFGPAGTSGSLASAGYQAGLWAWNTSPDPDGLRGIFTTGSPANFSRCASSAIDAALARGGATLDRPARVSAYRDFAQAYQLARCETPLYWHLDVGLASPRLHNFAPNPTAAGNLWNAADWWLS